MLQFTLYVQTFHGIFNFISHIHRTINLPEFVSPMSRLLHTANSLHNE
jgi:hypothetical protein